MSSQLCLKKLVGSDSIIQKAFDVLNSFYWTPEEIAIYDKIEKNQRDYINSMQGEREEGKKEGIEERNRQIVEAMLSKGLQLQEIADMTGINVEEVKKGMQQ